MKLVIILAAFSLIVNAQSPVNPALPMNVQTLTVPGSTPSTTLNLTVDQSPNGGDFIDAVSQNSAVQISLILPGGAVVTPANGSGLGFTVVQQVNSTSSPATSGIFTPFDTLGTHTTFFLPAASPGGVYQVQANSTGVTSTTLVTVTYFSMSGVTAMATTDQVTYAPGNSVSLVAHVLSGGSQVTGATVTATVVPPMNLNGQTSIGNYQVISQTVVGAYTQYTYQATLTNTGSAGFATAIAKLISVPSVATLLDAGTLGFAVVPAQGTVVSANTFSVQVLSSQTFDPTTLSWNINTTGTPVTVPLPDSGGGNYSSVYSPSGIGTYQVLVTFNGTSGGAAFARTAYTTFQVASPVASFSGVTDAAIDDNGNGLFDRLVLAAQVTAQTAGTYRFGVTLLASNGNTTTASGTATLPTGSGQISVNVTASQLLTLGVSGPYEKVRATVSQMPTTGAPVSVGFISDAGPTAPYTLASLDPGPISFTGQNSAAGVITGAGPTFDLLSVSIGVYSSSATNCSWTAVLTDSSGNDITFSSSGGRLTAGNNSVILNFNGNVIAQAANGPYIVTDAGIHCGIGQATASPLFQTQSFTASQFTLVTPNFSMGITSTPTSGPPGSNFLFGIFATATGPFSGAISLGVSGLPTGATAAFTVPTVPGFGPSTLNVTTTSMTPAGSYPLTITGTSGTLSHSTAATLTITSPPQVATPTFNPPAGTYNAAQTVTISTTTSGASIRYTTNGSTPSETSGTLYGGPITISTVTMLQAIAYASLMSDSTIASATYAFTPAGIVALSGGGQSTTIGTGFSTPLQATVTDYAGNPVTNASVTFTAPSTGASATFAGSSTFSAQTNTSGVATAPALTANATIGSYSITATVLVAGVATSASFSLTNNALPSIVVPSPIISGSGPFQNFSVTGSDPNGASSISALDMGFISTSGGTLKCIVEYVASKSAFYLMDSGDMAGPLATGSTGSIHNSSCVLTQPTVSFSGNQGTMNFLISFKAGFANSYDIIAYVHDSDGAKSSKQGIGSWTVSFVNQPPTATSATPSSGSGLSQTFTAVYSDPNGVGNISNVQFDIIPTTGTSGTPLCSVYYVTNWFLLITEPGNGTVGPMQAGTSGSISDGQCTLTNPSVSNSGGQLTLTLPITFNSSFTGSMYILMFIEDVNGLNTGYVGKGTWTVP
jgi:hypothetical protein